MAENTAGNGMIDVKQDDSAHVYLKDNPYPLPLAIDFEKYAKVLGNPDPHDPQVRALIETLFGMLDEIARLLFGTSTSQIACGQLTEIDSDSHIPSTDVLKSEDRTTTKDFTRAAKGGHE